MENQQTKTKYILDINDPDFKYWIHKIACGAIKDAINAHGPITPQLTNSAAKRVAGRICGELKAKVKINDN